MTRNNQQQGGGAFRRPTSFAYTQKWPGHVNVLMTDVGVSDAFDPERRPEYQPTIHQAVGIWDTGATGSVITSPVVAALGLKPFSRTTVSHFGGSGESAVYLVNIYLPNGVMAPGVSVTEATALAGGAGLLIGMDLIGLGDFSVTNFKGDTAFSFRMPSRHVIDYEEDDRRDRMRELSTRFKRNDKIQIQNPEDGAVREMKFKDARPLIEKGWLPKF